MPIKASKIESALRKKGFTEDVSKSHKKYVMIIDGKKTDINTHTSHGHKEIDDTMMNKMAKQMRITRRQFDLFAECTLSEEQYKKILVDNNLLDI